MDSIIPAEFISHPVMIRTLKTKSILSSLYKREELPLFVKWFDLLTILSLSKERGDLLARSRFGEGRGEILRRMCLQAYYGFLSNLPLEFLTELTS